MITDSKWNPKFHVFPQNGGWVNDPNGLCQINGLYHVFYQYRPDAADGSGRVFWGHSVSEDLLHWEFKGAPIAPEDLPHLFERFYRADKARSVGGFGLGLSIAKQLAENMKGKIAVTSNERDGTVFTGLTADTFDAFFDEHVRKPLLGFAAGAGC